MTIKNGGLDLNGFKLSTSGASLTIIFTGTANTSHTIVDTSHPSTGTLDIQSPNSGTWKGVAVYQDPATTTGVDATISGSTPTWAVSGLLYMPNAALTVSGAIDKQSAGYACVAIVAKSLKINGNGYIVTYYTGCDAGDNNLALQGSGGTGVRTALIG